MISTQPWTTSTAEFFCGGLFFLHPPPPRMKVETSILGVSPPLAFRW